MIETIYSNDSGEAGRANKVQVPFKMPKNIRQVGKSNAIKKIYVEDYVMTFIKQLAGGDYSGFKIAVLVGQCIRLENCRNIFISGAVEVNGFEPEGEITFSNDIWTGIYEEIKKYFVEEEIVGWFIGGPGYILEDEDKILKIHVDNFAGQDKVLLTYDNMEREEAFFSYENNHLCKQEGYYIYYEKNEEMQTYMISSKNGQSGEAAYDDKVSREIRTVLQSKKPSEEETRSVTRLMYAAGTLLAVIILVVAAAILNNYDQMKSMQKTMDYLSLSMEELQNVFVKDDNVQTSVNVSDSSEGNNQATKGATDSAVEATDTTGAEEKNLEVEVVPGDVEPLEKTGSQKGTEVSKGNEEEDDSNDKSPASGEDLATKGSDSSEVKSDQESATVQKEVKYYTVVSGDTLADISYRLYNTYTKVKTIMKLNEIEDQDIIYVGQKLIVP